MSSELDPSVSNIFHIQCILLHYSLNSKEIPLLRNIHAPHYFILYSLRYVSALFGPSKEVQLKELCMIYEYTFLLKSATCVSFQA